MHNLIKSGALVLALAAPVAQANAERLFALTTANQIATFDSATPGTIDYTGAVGGLVGGDTLIGIDLRPANRTLYSLGTSGNLYAITKNVSGRDYTATSVGIITVPLSGNNFGIDFNPMVDRLRVVSDTNQNLRINPNDPTIVGPPAGTINDTAVTLNGSNLVDLIAVGYRNSRPAAPSTVLYGLDANSDALVRASNANLGTYVTTNVLGNAFGPLGFSFGVGDRVAFDISGATNQGFFTINDTLYTVNQLSGAGALVGGIGVAGVSGLTAGGVPEPATWAMLIAGFGMVGAASRARRTTRNAVAV